MKLISLNIETNKHHDLILPFLKRENPDVFCAQEILEEDFAIYKRELGMDGVFAPCRYVRSKTCEESIGKLQGVSIFCKKILNSGEEFYLGTKEEVEKPFDAVNFVKTEALAWAEIEVESAVYKFVTLHLPVTEHGESTEEQLSAQSYLFKKLEPLGEFILCGDMNAPRGNETFRRFTEKYKDNIPLEYKTSIDQNLHRVKGIQFMVDCLFTTPSYTADGVKLVDGLSDHMAIVAEISKIQ
jgi:exonuclease III